MTLVIERLVINGSEETGPFTLVKLGDVRGCGFWLTTDGTSIAQAMRTSKLDEWYECAIPDAEHDGRDHILTLRRKGELTHA